MDDSLKVLLQVATDLQTSKNQIKADVKAIQKEIETNKIELGVKLDDSTIKSALKQVKSQQSDISGSLEALSSKTEIASNRFDIFTNKLKTTALQSPEVKAQMDNISNSFDKINQAIAKGDLTSAKSMFSKTKDEVYKFRTEMQKAGNVGDTFFTKLKKNLYNFVGFLSSATIIMSIVRGIRSMVTEVINLDTAMTSLRKVTNNTNEEYNNFLVTAKNNAKELGASLSDVVDATSEFARLGYTLSDSAELARIATLYQNIGDGISATESSQSIISTMKAFNITANEAESIVDKFNEVDILLAS